MYRHSAVLDPTARTMFPGIGRDLVCEPRVGRSLHAIRQALECDAHGRRGLRLCCVLWRSPEKRDRKKQTKKEGEEEEGKTEGETERGGGRVPGHNPSLGLPKEEPKADLQQRACLPVALRAQAESEAPS